MDVITETSQSRKKECQLYSVIFPEGVFRLIRVNAWLHSLAIFTIKYFYHYHLFCEELSFLLSLCFLSIPHLLQKVK